eukprot:3405773-Amphidinium_carterae.1
MSVVCNMWIWESIKQQVASAHALQMIFPELVAMWCRGCLPRQSEQAISMPLSPAQRQGMPLSPAQRQARELVLGKPTELQHLDEEFQRDPMIALAAVSVDGLALKYAATELQNDAKIVLRAVSRTPGALKYAGNCDVVLTVFRSLGIGGLRGYWSDLAEEHRSDLEIALACASRGALPLRDVAVELQSNHDIVLAAVRHHGAALKHAAVELQSNHDIVLAAVRHNGAALEHAAEELQSNHDIALAAVGNSPIALKFAADSLLQEEGFAVHARKYFAFFKIIAMSGRSCVVPFLEPAERRNVPKTRFIVAETCRRLALEKTGTETLLY